MLPDNGKHNIVRIDAVKASRGVVFDENVDKL